MFKTSISYAKMLDFHIILHANLLMIRWASKCFINTSIFYQVYCVPGKPFMTMNLWNALPNGIVGCKMINNFVTKLKFVELAKFLKGHACI